MNNTVLLNKGYECLTEKLGLVEAVTPACNGCATCQKVCPADNIKIENGKPVF